MSFYAIITAQGDADNLTVVCMADNQQTCENELQAIRNRYKSSGRHFIEDDWWIQEIEIGEGIFWECD